MFVLYENKINHEIINYCINYFIIEPIKKDAKSQLEATKRKSLSPRKETPEKIQKTCSSGKFINTLIAQWSKHMGVQTPVQSPGVNIIFILFILFLFKDNTIF